MGVFLQSFPHLQELQTLSDHLVQNLAAFAKEDQIEEASQQFTQLLKQCPLAELEVSKVNANAPVDVSTAGQMLAAILNLKSVFELRVVKKQSNTSHTYNGNKWLKKRFASSTPSSSQSKSRKTSEAQSAERPSDVFPLEDTWNVLTLHVQVYTV